MLTIVGTLGALAAGVIVGGSSARYRVGRLQPIRGRTGAPIFETDREPIFETDRDPNRITRRDVRTMRAPWRLIFPEETRFTIRERPPMRDTRQPIFASDTVEGVRNDLFERGQPVRDNEPRFQCSEVANYLPGWQKQEWNRAIALAERGDRSVARNVIAMLEAGTYYPYFTLETSREAARCMQRLLDSMVYDYEHQQTVEQKQPAQNPLRFDPRSLRRLRR